MEFCQQEKEGVMDGVEHFFVFPWMCGGCDLYPINHVGWTESNVSPCSFNCANSSLRNHMHLFYVDGHFGSYKSVSNGLGN